MTFDKQKYKHEWYLRNKKRLLPIMRPNNKKWQKENKEKVNLKSRRWQIKNKNIMNKNAKIYRLKHPIKFKARNYAKRNKQRLNFCQICGIEENLHFHHTNYILNQGITLCKDCHKRIHFGGY